MVGRVVPYRLSTGGTPGRGGRPQPYGRPGRRLSGGGRGGQHLSLPAGISGAQESGSSGEKKPKTIKTIYELLRTSRCLDFAKQAIARGLWELDTFDVSPRNNLSSNSHLYQELCQESAVTVIFGSNRRTTLDALLFLGYMGCLTHDVCREVYQQAITQIEQEGALLKMQELSTLGRVLGFLLKKDDLKLRMEKSETTWKWSSRLKGFDLPFDLIADGQDQRLTAELLPQIVKKSNFSLPTVLEFAQDFGLRKEEVLALWVQLMLLTPLAPPKNRCWTVQVSSEGQEVYRQVFDQSYQQRIPPHLAFLDDAPAVLQH
ncbi:unnamed protein product, partial [Amoebophrya sp. A25]|eukprot:GSA25T00022191001.1